MQLDFITEPGELLLEFGIVAIGVPEVSID